MSGGVVTGNLTIGGSCTRSKAPNAVASAARSDARTSEIAVATKLKLKLGFSFFEYTGRGGVSRIETKI